MTVPLWRYLDRKNRVHGIDAHREAAARVFGVPPRQVTEEQLRVAQRRGWATAYRAEPGTLLKGL